MYKCLLPSHLKLPGVLTQYFLDSQASLDSHSYLSATGLQYSGITFVNETNFSTQE